MWDSKESGASRDSFTWDAAWVNQAAATFGEACEDPPKDGHAIAAAGAAGGFKMFQLFSSYVHWALTVF